jgi:hypothetical protein
MNVDLSRMIIEEEVPKLYRDKLAKELLYSDVSLRSRIRSKNVEEQKAFVRFLRLCRPSEVEKRVNQLADRVKNL